MFNHCISGNSINWGLLGDNFVYIFSSLELCASQVVVCHGGRFSDRESRNGRFLAAASVFSGRYTDTGELVI